MHYDTITPICYCSVFTCYVVEFMYNMSNVNDNNFDVCVDTISLNWCRVHCLQAPNQTSPISMPFGVFQLLLKRAGIALPGTTCWRLITDVE